MKVLDPPDSRKDADKGKKVIVTQCNLNMRILPFFRVALLSHARIVMVFLTDFLKC